METNIMEAAVKANYTAHLDSKKRLTLHGAKHEYYNVKEYDNGLILLEPRKLKTFSQTLFLTSFLIACIIHSHTNG